MPFDASEQTRTLGVQHRLKPTETLFVELVSILVD